MASYLRGTRSEKKAKFARFCFDVADHNPLHLGISKSCSAQFFGDRLSNFAVASMRLENERSREGEGKRPALFVCLRILDDEVVRRSVTITQVVELPDVIPLYATDTFHEHYNIPYEEDVYIYPVKAFPFTKVVYGAKTKRCYEWAKNRVFSTGLLVSVCQQRVLARLHDSFLAPVIPVLSQDEAYSLQLYEELLTLECEPTMQGVISVNTAVIITDLSANVDKLPHVPLSRFLGVEERQLASSPNQPAPAGVDPQELLVTELMEKKSEMICLRPLLVPKFSTIQVAGNNQNIKESLCEKGCQIFVKRSAIRRLGVPNGSWVVISVSDFAPKVQTAKTLPPEQAESHNGTHVEDVDTSKESVTQSENVVQDTTAIEMPKPKVHICQIIVHDDQQNRSATNSGIHAPFLHPKEDLVLNTEEVALSPILWFNLHHHPAPLIQPDTCVYVRVINCDKSLMFKCVLHSSVVVIISSSSSHNRHDNCIFYFKIQF